jgi:hypothetical protein
MAMTKQRSFLICICAGIWVPAFAQQAPDAQQPADTQQATAAQQLGQRLGAQVHTTEGYGGNFVDGFWNPVYHEDSTERGTGPDQGDYAGLPITKEATLHAQIHDPEIMDIPEYQCRPHPSIYGMRGAGGLVRIWQDLDPVTQQQTKIELRLRWQQQHRVIWMEEHEHPPPWAEHTWQGFSTGHWVGDVLEVHTDMLKAAYIRRNGLDTDDRATSDERFFRYGNLMVHIMMVSDPGVLTEPLIKSNNFVLYPNATMSPYPCQALTEIPRAEGAVPMHMPNQIRAGLEWAIRNHVPIEASYGGAQTMLPAYQDYMKTLPPNPPLSSIDKLAAGGGKTEGQ